MGIPAQDEFVSIVGSREAMTFTLNNLNATHEGHYNCFIKGGDHPSIISRLQKRVNKLKYQSFLLTMDAEKTHSEEKRRKFDIRRETSQSVRDEWVVKNRTIVKETTETEDAGTTTKRGRNDNIASEANSNNGVERNDEGNDDGDDVWDFRSSSMKSELMTSKLKSGTVIDVMTSMAASGVTSTMPTRGTTQVSTSELTTAASARLSTRPAETVSIQEGMEFINAATVTPERGSVDHVNNIAFDEALAIFGNAWTTPSHKNVITQKPYLTSTDDTGKRKKKKKRVSERVDIPVLFNFPSV